MKKVLLLIQLMVLVTLGCSKSDEQTAQVETFAGVKFKANGVQHEWIQAKYGFAITKVSSFQDYPNGGFMLKNENVQENGLLIEMFIGTTLSTGFFRNVDIFPTLNNIEHINPTACSVTITKINKGLCSGTFVGTAFADAPGNQQLLITEGQFTDIPIKN